MSPAPLGLSCRLMGRRGRGRPSGGLRLPKAIPRGSNSLPVCAFQNQLLTKGMVILRDKIRFYEGECGGPQRGLSAGTCHHICWDTWPCVPCLCPRGSG